MIISLLTAALAVFTLRVSRFVRSHTVRQYIWAIGVDLAVFSSLTLALPDLPVLWLLLLGSALSLGILSAGIFWRAARLLTDMKPLPRRYRRSGLWAALGIQRAAFPGLLPTWAFLSAAVRGRVYVRCVDGTSVALAIVERLPGVNWLCYLAVDNDHRRQGHARVLLSELGPLALTVREDNDQAVKLYLSVGFREVVRWPNYYGPSQAGVVFLRVE